MSAAQELAARHARPFIDPARLLPASAGFAENTSTISKSVKALMAQHKDPHITTRLRIALAIAKEDYSTAARWGSVPISLAWPHLRHYLSHFWGYVHPGASQFGARWVCRNVSAHSPGHCQRGLQHCGQVGSTWLQFCQHAHFSLRFQGLDAFLGAIQFR